MRLSVRDLKWEELKGRWKGGRCLENAGYCITSFNWQNRTIL